MKLYAAILSVSLAATVSAFAADRTWNAPVGSSAYWEDESSWSGSIVPLPSDNAKFDSANAYTVNMRGTNSIYNMTLGKGRISFDLGAGNALLLGYRTWMTDDTYAELLSGTISMEDGERFFLGDSGNGGSTFVVDGSNSLFRSAWKNYIISGQNKTHNTILIRNGGCGEGNFSAGSNAHADFNTIRITGEGSMLFCTNSAFTGNSLSVGGQGANNTLVIEDGGLFTNSIPGRVGYIGSNNNGSNNTVVVDGGTFYSAGGICLGNGGNNSIVGNNDNLFVVRNGGTAFIGHSPAMNQYSVVMGIPNNHGNGIVVQTNGYLYVDTSLIISDINANCYSNFVQVVGEGAMMEVKGDLRLGGKGCYSHLEVLDSGYYYCAAAAVYLGHGNGSGVCGFNSAQVSGTGSVVRVKNFVVGNGGSSDVVSNSLVVADGGLVETSAMRIGNGAKGFGNFAVAAAGGTIACTNDTLYVGYECRESRLVASNGVVCAKGNITLAEKVSASNAVLRVEGTSPRIDIGTNLHIRYGSSVEFAPTRFGYAAAPVKADNISLSAGVGMRVKVEAGEWYRRTGGVLPLISLNASNPTTLQSLADSMVVENVGFDCRALVSDDGKTLYLRAPAKGGTIIFLR